MPQWIIDVATTHDILVYAVIFVFNYAIGPWLAMICGALARLGYINIFYAYIVFMMSDLVGDAIWYRIGRQYGMRFVRRFGKFFSVTEVSTAKVGEIYHRYKYSILFLSKISNGFGLSIAVLMTAGLVRIPFYRYMAVNLAGQFIWSGLLLSSGYFFEHLYVEFNDMLSRMAIVAVFILLILAFWGYSNYLKNKLEHMP